MNVSGGSAEITSSVFASRLSLVLSDHTIVTICFTKSLQGFEFLSGKFPETLFHEMQQNPCLVYWGRTPCEVRSQTLASIMIQLVSRGNIICGPCLSPLCHQMFQCCLSPTIVRGRILEHLCIFHLECEGILANEFVCCLLDAAVDIGLYNVLEQQIAEAYHPPWKCCVYCVLKCSFKNLMRTSRIWWIIAYNHKIRDI